MAKQTWEFFALYFEKSTTWIIVPVVDIHSPYGALCPQNSLTHVKNFVATAARFLTCV